MRRLRSRVHNRCWPNSFDEPQDSVAISNINFVVLVAGNLATQTLQRPRGVAIRSKENCPLIVVHTNNRVSRLAKMNTNFGTD
jgi:hypothetical protein